MDFPVYIVALWKIAAEVRAAALLSTERRPRDQQTHGDDRVEALQAAIGRGRHGAWRAKRGPPAREAGVRLFKTCPVAEEADVAPHQVANGPL
jgi:hypothetical protein